MPGPEDRQVSHFDPGHDVHVTCMSKTAEELSMCACLGGHD